MTKQRRAFKRSMRQRLSWLIEADMDTDGFAEKVEAFDIPWDVALAVARELADEMGRGASLEDGQTVVSSIISRRAWRHVP